MLNVDVIIPAHNEGRGIARTLLSISQQLVPGYRLRVIVVANACTDDTVERAKCAIRALPQDPDKQFTVIENHVLGQTAAYNCGLEHSSADPADIVILTDADVWYEVDCFALVLDSFKDPAVWLSGPTVIEDITPELAGSDLGLLYRLRQLRRLHAPIRTWPFGPMFAYRRAVHKEIGPYSESYVGSSDKWLMLNLIQLHEWEAVTLADGAVVYTAPPVDWGALIAQGTRWAHNVTKLLKHFPELASTYRELEQRYRQLTATAELRRPVLLEAMAREGIPPWILDLELYLIAAITSDNASIACPTADNGQWQSPR